jgi:SAM-dependent methyltransferase
VDSNTDPENRSNIQNDGKSRYRNASEDIPLKTATQDQASPNRNDFLEFSRTILGNILGGRILDVATAHGSFVHVLKNSLYDYGDIFAVDIDSESLKTAHADHTHTDVRFCQMDAERLAFRDGSFDTVSIGVSLHHLANIEMVLDEMLRVLRDPNVEKGCSGGTFIVSEMYRDAQTDAQRTIVYMHDWVAEVDTATGISHNPTFTRQEIIDIFEGLGLRDLALYDRTNVNGDPKDEAIIKQGEATIRKVTQRAKGLPNYEALKRRGEDIAARLHDVGAQIQPVLIATGKK